eukprot:477285_1
MGNFLPQLLHDQSDNSEQADSEQSNKIDHNLSTNHITVDNEISNNNTIIESVLFQNRIVVGAWVRLIEPLLYAIVPDSIKQLICQYYDSWMKLAPPPKTTLVYPNPLCYYSSTKQRDYIIIAPHFRDSKQIIQFDTKLHKWSVLTQYPNGFDCSCPGFVHDTINKLLYFCFGYDEIFGWFDLKTNEWNVKCSGNSNIDGNPSQFGIKSVGIPPTCFVSELNQIHAIVLINKGYVGEKNIHMKYSSVGGKFEKCSDFETLIGIRNVSIVYIEKKKLMLSIGGLDGWVNGSPCDKMYYCIIENDHNCLWNEFECRFPYKSNIQCQVIFDTLLIGYFKQEKELWCLDLDKYIGGFKYEWIKCLGVHLEMDSYYNIVVTQKGFIHFIDAFTEKHCKVHLSQILPAELYDKYCLI